MWTWSKIYIYIYMYVIILQSFRVTRLGSDRLLLHSPSNHKLYGFGSSVTRTGWWWSIHSGGEWMGLAIMFARRWSREFCLCPPATWCWLSTVDTKEDRSGSCYPFGSGAYLILTEGWLQLCFEGKGFVPRLQVSVSKNNVTVVGCSSESVYHVTACNHCTAPLITLFSGTQHVTRLKNYWAIHAMVKMEAFQPRKPSEVELRIVLESFNSEFQAM